MNELLAVVGSAVLFVAVMGGLWALHRALHRALRGRVLVSLGASTLRAADLPMRVRAERNALSCAHQPLTHDTADLGLGADRLVLVGDRGVWLSIGPGIGRMLGAARCPVHGLLVLEGATPTPDGQASFRIELSMPDAADWAERLQPFVVLASGAPRYAVRPPF